MNTAQEMTEALPPLLTLRCNPKEAELKEKGLGRREQEGKMRGAMLLSGSVARLQGENGEALQTATQSWVDGGSKQPSPNRPFPACHGSKSACGTHSPHFRSDHLDTLAAAGEARGPWAAPLAHAWLHHNGYNAPKLVWGRVKPHSKWQACICGGG